MFPQLSSSSETQITMCAASTWAARHCLPREGGKKNQCEHEAWRACVRRVIKSFVSEARVFCLPPATIKLWQAIFLACKDGKISDLTWFLIVCNFQKENHIESSCNLTQNSNFLSPRRQLKQTYMSTRKGKVQAGGRRKPPQIIKHRTKPYCKWLINKTDWWPSETKTETDRWKVQSDYLGVWVYM